MTQLLGILFILFGVVALVSPDSLMPKLERTAGGKKETYKLHYGPVLTIIIGLSFVIFGACLLRSFF
ncbi:MAG: hypothetical protein BWY24_00335 [Microgenomates group bacterium ADurb.Bin219]|nr:MAG: hypothetical protein BWY24_00335 [Microgenomates group bacterium ADurb.Bin219]